MKTDEQIAAYVKKYYVGPFKKSAGAPDLIVDSFDQAVVDVRGWGRLHTDKDLSFEDAAKIQDAFAAEVVIALNKHFK